MTTDPSIKTVLVTGGNGCLGRFIVNLILEKLPYITTIKVFDKNPSGKEYFTELANMQSENEETSPEVKIEYLIGDLRNSEAIRRAVRGVDCVFHTAGLVDVSMFPAEILLWTVNCRGTQDLLEACFDQNVPYLIYTSSVNSVLGMETVTEGTEKEMPKPQTWFWGGYGETKWYAEQVVLDADNIPLLNGGRLRTLCLRPTTFYGENDAINVPRYLATAQRCGGKLWRIGGEDLTVQQTYVGNVAWAHLAALEALLKYPEKCAGEAFFVTDNTPAMNVFSFVLPFLEDHGLRLSSFRLPFALVYFGFMVFIFLLNAFRKFFPDWKIPKSVSDFSLSQIAFLNMKASFCRNKAEDRLSYQPLFSFEESIDRSRKYYKHQE